MFRNCQALPLLSLLCKSSKPVFLPHIFKEVRILFACGWQLFPPLELECTKQLAVSEASISRASEARREQGKSHAYTDAVALVVHKPCELKTVVL